MALDGSRVDQYNVTVKIGDVDDGTWDKMSGGEMDSEETKYRPGGMAAMISLGGSRAIGNVTVSRIFKPDVDVAKIKAWMEKAGKAKVVVTKQSLDIDGNATGMGNFVYTGILKAVTPPEVDSEGTDAAMVEIEVSTGGTVA